MVAVTRTSCAWSEGGHHLIASMAFDLLTADQQNCVIDVLKSHPRFAEDFSIPAKIENPELWLIGRAAYWPDFVGSQPKFNRPNWHFQRGSVLTIGNVEGVPQNPGGLPNGSDLETKDLFIIQALELCRKIYADKDRPAADRAVALCWICHIVADAHQPCHSGSIYHPRIFGTAIAGDTSFLLSSQKICIRCGMRCSVRDSMP